MPTTATRNAARTFDPVRVGRLECAAWAAYYRREWWPFLRAAVGMVDAGFQMSRRRTVVGAWHVLRANQVWAPYPDNDPDAAREHMRRFYALVFSRRHPTLEPARAAALEVEWWRVHRTHQHAEPGDDRRPLVDALAALYAYVYDVAEPDVRAAAEQRALAMDHSDRWVQEGCDPASPLIGQERAALVRSYAALLAAVHR